MTYRDDYDDIDYEAYCQQLASDRADEAEARRAAREDRAMDEYLENAYDARARAYAELKRCMANYHAGRITRYEMEAALSLWRFGLWSWEQRPGMRKPGIIYDLPNSTPSYTMDSRRTR